MCRWVKRGNSTIEGYWQAVLHSSQAVLHPSQAVLHRSSSQFCLYRNISQDIPKDDRQELIKCKEYLKEAEARRDELDLTVKANRAALLVLRDKGERAAERWRGVISIKGTFINQRQTNIRHQKANTYFPPPSYTTILHAGDRLLDSLDNAASVWKDVQSQAPITKHNIVPLTKLWSQKTDEEMESYQASVADQVRYVCMYVCLLLVCCSGLSMFGK